MNFECREEEVAKIDMERMVVVAGQEEDETSLLVKDSDGNVIKGVPVWSANKIDQCTVWHIMCFFLF